MGISLEDAAVTCAGFELAFSDDGMRRAIFGIIDQLDESAAKKGEPLGLIIRYAVELGQDGIWVGRYADEIPAGEIVELTPTDRAMIFLKIKDNFPTQEFLGPMIVNRPEFLINPKSEIRNPKSNCGVVFSDGEFTEPEIPTELPSHWPDVPICLGPIRLKFNERFPFISGRGSQCFPVTSHRLPFTDHGFPFTWYSSSVTGPLPPWAALQAGTPAFQSTSGLSPPLRSENLGHSERKMFLRHWQ